MLWWRKATSTHPRKIAKEGNVLSWLLHSMCEGHECLCVLGHIQVWINQGDIVLISLRDYQDAKADVILNTTPTKPVIWKHTVNFQKMVRGVVAYLYWDVEHATNLPFNLQPKSMKPIPLDRPRAMRLTLITTLMRFKASQFFDSRAISYALFQIVW